MYIRELEKIISYLNLVENYNNSKAFNVLKNIMSYLNSATNYNKPSKDLEEYMIISYSNNHILKTANLHCNR